MLDKIGAVLNHISLTLTQWVLLLMAAIIGLLLTALKLQGSQLHKAQVQLLQQHLQSVNDKDDEAIKVSRDRLNKALSDYATARKE